LKFLRKHFELTQEQIGEHLEIDRYEISKMESIKSERIMNSNTQLRLKLYYAEKLGIKDADLIYNLNRLKNNPVDIQKILPDKQLIKEIFFIAA